MMGLMSDVLRTHGYVRGPRATGHVAALEPSHTRRRVWSHGHVVVPKPCQAVILVLDHVATPEPSYAGGRPGATRYVVTPEPSPAG
jgi:hypothetical protein